MPAGGGYGGVVMPRSGEPWGLGPGGFVQAGSGPALGVVYEKTPGARYEEAAGAAENAYLNGPYGAPAQGFQQGYGPIGIGGIPPGHQIAADIRPPGMALEYNRNVQLHSMPVWDLVKEMKSQPGASPPVYPTDWFGPFGAIDAPVVPGRPGGDPGPGQYWDLPLGGFYGATPQAVSTVVQGKGGYSYQLLSDDSILIVASPAGGAGTIVKPGTSAWTAINKEVGNWPRITGGMRAAALAAAVGTGTGTAEGAAVASIIGAFQSQGKQAGYEAAAQAAGQFGPGMISAAADFVKDRKSSAKALQKKYAKAKWKCAYYKRIHNTKKASKWCHKLEMYRQMLASIQQTGAPPQIAGEASAPSGLPAWALPVGLAAGLGLFVVVIASSGKKAA